MGSAKNTKNTGHSLHLLADALHCTSSLGRRASAPTVMARRGISGLWESKGIHIYKYTEYSFLRDELLLSFSGAHQLSTQPARSLAAAGTAPGLVVLRSRAGGFVHQCQ